MENSEYDIPILGKRTLKSPLNLSQTEGDGLFEYVTDEDRVVYDTTLQNYIRCRDKGELPISFEKAGPRQQIFFEPAKTKVAIVTCGGLCPGLNNVIRSLVLTLWQRYGVKRIVGVQYGYEGFIAKYNHDLVDLTPDMVDKIHTEGGTILGSSRGEQNVSEIVDALEVMNVNILFCIGGDGTLRGAQAITDEIAKRGLKIAVGGIPKTIDNDISMIDRSFGFETACSIATEIIYSGHNEAHGAYNGIALIKLMGRDSGFIAAHAALSNQEVNFVLIPEMDFDLYGGRGFLKVLRKRLEERHHAVIVVAEGAGQHLFEDRDIIKKDSSGNAKYKDIGIFLKEKIQDEFNNKEFPYSLKYIDPSYIIRSAPANPQDSKFCLQLAQHAVHAAMVGKTGFVVGNRSGMFTLLPIPVAVKQRKKIDLQSELWFNVLEATGQPATMKN
jgi:6-phosphofructokinase 1